MIVTQSGNWNAMNLASAENSHLLFRGLMLALNAHESPRCGHGLVATNRRHLKPSWPKVLTDQIPLPLSVHLRQMDRALPLDISNHARYRVLKWYRDHPVHMVGPQMPFFNLTLLLLR
jgi:hypothetical protein